ncbi:MAG: hypothetical protein Q9M20_02250 [Mariprofundaceae bacterium]|nr:hypothetical protein [Mariprofundaceae bacterium]
MNILNNKFSLLTFCLVCVLTSGLASANPDVTSREYKLMLKTSQFNYLSESSNVDALMQSAKLAIQTAIQRNVTGTPILVKNRDIHFFDTLSSCTLKSLGYSFRERIENGLSEVTLKYRSPDRYISDFENLSASTSSAKTKLESDIGANTSNNFKVLYSHSTTEKNTRTLNNIKDINKHFPGFASNYGLSNTLPLTLVGYTSIREHVYRNVMIDLGQFTAEISVTLWYEGVPISSQAPLVAEISFKYADKSASYTNKVVNRAQKSFVALRGLSAWIDPNSQTKTAFLYSRFPGFCQ